MADPLSGTQLLEAMKSYATGILKGNTADTLGAPVDLINEAISPITKRLGMYSADPVGGAKQFRRAMGMSETDANLAETAGSMLSAGGAAKAMIVGAARLDKLGKVNLYQAEKLFPRGQKPVEVYDATGVYKDKGEMKAVISDKNAKVNRDFIGNIASPTPLSAVLDHKELFDLYPELKSVGVYIDPNLPKGTLGQYHPVSKEVGVHQDLAGEELRSVILHEVQHGVQRIEGWQGGGNARQFIPFNPAKVQEKITAARESGDPGLVEAAERFKTIANMKIREAGNRYANLPGEQEARYTQETMNMSLPELANDVLSLIRKGDTPSTYDTRPIRPVFGGSSN